LPKIYDGDRGSIAVLACVRYIFRDETLTGQALVVPHPLEKGYTQMYPNSTLLIYNYIIQRVLNPIVSLIGSFYRCQIIRLSNANTDIDMFRVSLPKMPN
jgi:hypothetical protein